MSVKLTLVPTPVPLSVAPDAASSAPRKFSGIELTIADAAKLCGFKDQEITKLATDISAHEALKNLDAHAVNESIVNAFNAASKQSRTDGAVDLFHAGQVTIDHVLEAAGVVVEGKKNFRGVADPMRVEKLKAHAKKTLSSASTKSPRVRVEGTSQSLGNTMNQDWRNLATEHKLNAGMWGAGALLGAFFTYGAVKASFAPDEDGKIHMQWSNVGVALLQASIAVGSAAMAVMALRGAAAR